LRGREEHEVIDPAEIGILESEMALSARSGRTAVRRLLQELGYTLDEEEFERVYTRFKDVARKKPSVDVRDLVAIVTGETSVFLPETYELVNVQVTCGTNALPMAAVCLSCQGGEPLWATSHGNGPVDAVYKAIDKLVGESVKLTEFVVEAMTEGVEAVGKVTVRLRGEVPGNGGRSEWRTFIGRGADTDIIVASAKAYLFALNRFLAAKQSAQRREVVTQEVKRSLAEMYAEHGAIPPGDFMGWSVLREDSLV